MVPRKTGNMHRCENDALLAIAVINHGHCYAQRPYRQTDKLPGSLPGSIQKATRNDSQGVRKKTANYSDNTIMAPQQMLYRLAYFLWLSSNMRCRKLPLSYDLSHTSRTARHSPPKQQIKAIISQDCRNPPGTHTNTHARTHAHARKCLPGVPD